MILVLLLFIATTIWGSAVTYLYDDDSPAVVRVASGTAIGMALLGLVGFIVSMTVGLDLGTVVAALILSAFPLLVFMTANTRKRFRLDIFKLRDDAKSFLANLSPARIALALSYLALIVMMAFFFDRAMIETGGGIGTGAVNNLGDLPFHLLVVNSFAYGQNFPPDNPIYSGVTFTYSFIADLVVAMTVVAGAKPRTGMFLQNLILVISLITLTAHFTFRLTRSKTAASIAPFLLLFNGGLGFLLFFSDAVASDAGILGQIFQLNTDYTLRGGTIWRWGNSLTVLFTTQRTILLGMPLALIVLTQIWNQFFNDKQLGGEPKDLHAWAILASPLSRKMLVVGLVAGMLPLVHAHTFAVTMGMALLLAVITWRQWRFWILFFVGASLVAVPELLYVTSGGANEAQSFVGWELGWDNGDHNALWFWFVNTGLFIPLLAIAIYRLATWRSSDEENVVTPSKLLLFYAPFALCFVIPNFIRLAPWVWDNVKVLIFWYVVSIPLVAWLLAEIWKRSRVAALVAPALFVCLTLAGGLDVFRIATRQVEHQILPPEMIAVAERLKETASPRSLILTAPEFASVPVLTGQRWFLGYTGHVWSHGMSPSLREDAVRTVYAGGEKAKDVIDQNRIDYILIGPQERRFAKVNEGFFQAFPIVAEAGEYKVYRVSRS